MGDNRISTVHSCEPGSSDHEDHCDAVFVWAETEDKAIEQAKPFMASESGYAESMPELEKHRGAIGDVKAVYQMAGVLDDKALREARFMDDSSASCEACGLYEFESIPESIVCDDCLQCRECGCCGCCEVKK